MPTNPLQDGLRLEPTPGPTTLVIFGATGDLTRRKLLPAVYNLSRGQRLPARFSVLGVGREPMLAHASALGYFDSYRTARLPQSLTQAQRDAFGAHTYERIDRQGAVHSEW